MTFLAKGQSLRSTQPFNPSLPQNIFQRGGKAYDGHSYYNSGVMTNVSDSGFRAVTAYTLAFPHKGNFTYYCLVHGMAMKGVVHVRAAGTDYPYSQAQYDRQAAEAGTGHPAGRAPGVAGRPGPGGRSHRDRGNG